MKIAYANNLKKSTAFLKRAFLLIIKGFSLFIQGLIVAIKGAKYTINSVNSIVKGFKAEGGLTDKS